MATLANEEFYFVVPTGVEAWNDCINPSVEENITNWNPTGAGYSILRSAAYARRGAWSIEITPASGVAGGCYLQAGTLEKIGVTQYLSADVFCATAGLPGRIAIKDLAGSDLSATTFTTTGYWQRVKVARVGTAGLSRRLFIGRDSYASTAKIYVDGIMYSETDTMYFDGYMKGFVPTRVDYAWSGAPGSSKSWRSPYAGTTGTMLRLKDLCTVMFVLGLGMTPVTNAVQPLALDYDSYQTTWANAREVIFNLVFSGSLNTMMANRQTLIDAIRPDRLPDKQPVRIVYQGYDGSGNEATEPCYLDCHYVDGLDNQPQVPGVDKAQVRFAMYLPYIQKGGQNGVKLGVKTEVTGFSNIGYRDLDGSWKPVTSGTDGVVRVVSVDPWRGAVYVGGGFTWCGAVGGTSRICNFQRSYDGTITWVSIGSGAADGFVRDLAWGLDKMLYVAGSFTTMGGVTTRGIIKYNPDTMGWSALGTGLADGEVDQVIVGDNGYVYIFGTFTGVGGVANTKYAAYWNGSVWNSMGGAVNSGYIYAATKGLDGNIYVTGLCSSLGGVSVGKAAKWNVTTNVWTSMGTSGYFGQVIIGTSMTTGPDGTIYMGGSATWLGSDRIGTFKWNGIAWEAVSEQGSDGPSRLAFDPEGNLWAVGHFYGVGGVRWPDGLMFLKSGYWIPGDVNVQDTGSYWYGIDWDAAGRLIAGGGWTGSTALSGTVTASPAGGARAYPVVTFLGPGNIWQLKNYTTKVGVYFKNLTLVAGERAVLDLRPGQVSFWSDTRGDMTKYILNASNVDFYLIKGANSVSAFLTGTDANTEASMWWNDLYVSSEGAKR